MSQVEKLFVNVDGASKGNPGRASIGVIVTDSDGNVIEELSKEIGRATNNIAEYKALISGCKIALEYSPAEVVFLTDSQLVANQINGSYEAREPHLQKLLRKVRELLENFDNWKVNHVERQANQQADRLANKAFRSTSTENRPEQSLRKDKQKAKSIIEDLNRNKLKRALAFLSGLVDQID